MLAGYSAMINTMMCATPLLGTTIAFLVGTTKAGGAGPFTRAIGGGIAGGIVAAGWEFTVNNADRPEIKAEVISGSAAIGALSGVVGPMLFRQRGGS